MATTLAFRKRPLVGAAVYQAFSPNKPGLVIEDLTPSFEDQEKNYTQPKVIIKWLNGEVTEEKIAGLNDFDALIEDHKRKYENQAKLREKLLENV